MSYDIEWIKVENELPKPWQSVIAWAEDGDSQVNNLMQQATFDGRDFSIGGYYTTSMRGVTHWMPMPDAPTEDTPQ
jgi:hypothetical protein